MNERPERLRLFVGVDVPPGVLEELDAAIEPQRVNVTGARWAPLENQHITLKFLGSVDTPLLREVEGACRTVASATDPAEIAVAHVGAFPSARRARVLWAGVEDETTLLAGLATRLDAALVPLGFEPEKRAFTAHLTLARLRMPADVRVLVSAVTFRSERFVVSEFHLFRSRLSPKGARYEVLNTFVLADGTGRKS